MQNFLLKEYALVFHFPENKNIILLTWKFCLFYCWGKKNQNFSTVQYIKLIFSCSRLFLIDSPFCCYEFLYYCFIQLCSTNCLVISFDLYSLWICMILSLLSIITLTIITQGNCGTYIAVAIHIEVFNLFLKSVFFLFIIRWRTKLSV